MWILQVLPESWFSDIFSQKIYFWYSHKNKEKIEGERDLVFTFLLLNRGVPDIETIYFISTEQKN